MGEVGACHIVVFVLVLWGFGGKWFEGGRECVFVVDVVIFVKEPLNSWPGQSM